MEESMEIELESAIEGNKIEDSGETSEKLFNINTTPISEIQMSDSRYENRAGTFLTGINTFSKEEKVKMEERAKRFGLTEKLKNNLSDPEQDLYASMGIIEENDNTKNIRFNVIHMRGTEDMSTKDVFKYFEDYAPASIEWINDVSCNIVWLDNVSTARAMFGLSKKIIGLGETSSQKERNAHDANSDTENNVQNEDSNLEIDNNGEVANETNNKSEKDNYVSVKDINCPLPPGIWRKGIDYPKSKGIFLRFATRSDKKQPNAEKMSDYYKKYGNPNFGGIKGILTETRKRMYKQVKQIKRKLIDEPQSEDQPRKRIKNPWGALSETWGLNDVVEQNFAKVEQREQGRSVKERLGVKVPQNETVPTKEQTESSSGSDSEDDWCKRSKVLRMRMHADDEEEKIVKRRAKQQTGFSNNFDKNSDLRAKLGKSKKEMPYREAIQVVVTNANATRGNPAARELSEEEDGEIVESEEGQEKEEGEWQGSEEEEEEPEEDVEQEDTDEESANDEPVKEVQGPKGSVIKVVQHKPRVASTVWARLNNVQSDVIDSTVQDRQARTRDLRNTLASGDLRSRIGNHTRGRSPLRIEVKNDKYTKDESETE